MSLGGLPNESPIVNITEFWCQSTQGSLAPGRCPCASQCTDCALEEATASINAEPVYWLSDDALAIPR